MLKNLSRLIGDETSTNNVKNLWSLNLQDIVNDNSMKNTQPSHSVRIDN